MLIIEVERDRYLALLTPAERAGRRRGLLTGVGTGVHWLLTYGMDGICLAYGTRLVLADLDTPAEHRKYVIGVLFSVSPLLYLPVLWRPCLKYCILYSC